MSTRFELAHPWALALLVLPLVLAWLAMRFARARREPTGTVPIWREVARDPARTSERRLRLPWKWLLLVAALCAAVLALSGPRSSANASNSTWRAVVDRSPSMYLPARGGNGPTRLEVALAAAREELDALNAREVEWIASSGEFALSRRGSEPPAEWLREPRGGWDEPRWELYDQPATLWVTDHDRASHLASVAASGGEAVAGTIARFDLGEWRWDGKRTSWHASIFTQIPIVEVDETLLRTSLLRAIGAWIRARGYNMKDRPEHPALRVVVGGEGEWFDAEVGRDGWSATIKTRAVPIDAETPSHSWLVARRPDGTQVDVVRWSRGEVRVGWNPKEVLSGDPAAFAVSWAELFDAALVQPGCVSVAERSAAGAPSLRRGAASDSERPGDSRATALLAALAALLALVSLTLRD